MCRSEIAITLVLIILCSGCSHDGIVAPNEDTNLENSLVGNWSIGEGHRIKFNSDRTYVDSVWGPSVVIPGQTYLAFTSAGKYSVTRSILSFTNVRYTVFLDSGITNPGYYNGGRTQEIELQGNRIVCQPVDILKAEGEFSTELHGSWSMISEISWGNYSGLVYSGRLLRRYTFGVGSDSCAIETQYLDGHPEPDTTVTRRYTYLDPILNLPTSYLPNIRVAFKNRSMYWYYIFDAHTMTRN